MDRTRGRLSFVAVVLSCVSMANAQVSWNRVGPIQEIEKAKWKNITVAEAIQTMEQMNVADAAKNLAVFGMTSQTLTLAHARFMQTLDDSRTDKQVVAGSAAGGTGDPVDMPGLPGLLAYAVSTGAVTQTVNQNVVTLSANADGLYKFVAGQNPACPKPATQADNGDAAKVEDACTPPSWANDVSLSAAFNVGSSTQTVSGQSAATGATQNAVASVTGKDFSSASARYAFTNTRSPKSRESVGKFELKMNPDTYSRFSGPGGQIVAYIASLLRSTIATQELAGFEGEVPNLKIERLQSPSIRLIDAWQGLIKAVGEDDRNKAGESATSVEVECMRLGLEVLKRADPSFDEKFAILNNAYVKFMTTEAVTPADQVYGPMITAEYTFSRPPLEPDLHTFTFIGSFSPGANSESNPGTLTGNVGLSVYSKAQPTNMAGGTGFLRNAQAAAQFDRSWDAGETPIQVSLGAYIQYQIEPGIISIPSGST